MAEKIRLITSWVNFLHAVFALGFFLVMPLFKAVYIGERFFWLQYEPWRIFAIIMYLCITSAFSVFVDLRPRRES